MRRILDETPYGRNDFEGFGTKRVYALFAKTRVWDAPATSPLVLGVAEALLGPSCQLSAPTGIEIGPGEKAQVLHRDDGIYPVPQPHGELVLNTMWPLDDFTEENGATRIVPGSHRWAERPDPHATDLPIVCAEMGAGSVLFYTGSVTHGGGANRTDERRVGIAMNYCAGYIRQQENQQLGIPREIAAGFEERLQRLCGYGVYNGLIGHIDKQDPIGLLRGNGDTSMVWDLV
jgi:ectoine hydroxylase-related dioxygenase (phytanoyl-CoA dioxygenase family)